MARHIRVAFIMRVAAVARVSMVEMAVMATVRISRDIAAVAVADMAMLRWPQAHIATLADWAMAQVAAAVRTPIRAKARRASA